MDKVLGSQTLADKMEELMALSNVVQCHKIYMSQRGWFPPMARVCSRRLSVHFARVVLKP